MSNAPALPRSVATGHRQALDRIATTFDDAHRDDPGRRRFRRACVIGTAAGFAPFLAILWDFRLHPLRTAEARAFASNFYDVQARALLSGHLAAPEGAFGFEGFEIGGRTYMYFPPFPALLRMPVMVFTDRLDGRLTATSMLLAWVVLAAATALVLWRIRLLVRPSESVSRRESAFVAITQASVTGGSVVVYLAANPWVFHEAYLWSIALTVGTIASVLDVVLRGRVRSVLFASLFALGTILTRTTAGWPMALLMITTGLWLMVTRTAFRDIRLGRLLAAAAVVPLAIGIIVNEMKFGHPFMIPLEHQVWTGVNPHRRLALGLNDGSLAGPQFLLTTVVNYLRPDGIRFVGYFPFVTLPAEPAASYGGAFLDMTYRTGSVVAFMPLLVILALFGAVAAFRRNAPVGLVAVRLPMLLAAAVPCSILVWGYLAHRYTSEFAPVLVVAGGVGMYAVDGALVNRPRAWKRGVIGVVGALAAFGAVANLAIAFTASRVQSGGAQLVDYVELQSRISGVTGDPLDALVSQSDDLPPDAPPDRLHIVGNCDGLYLSTGELYKPWVPLEVRDQSVVIEADPAGLGAATVWLFEIEGYRRRIVSIETNDRDEARLRVSEGVYSLPTDWFPLRPGERVEVRMRADPAREVFLVTAGDRYRGEVRSGEWTRGYGVFELSSAHILGPSGSTEHAGGLTVTGKPGPAPPLCSRLLRDAD